MLFTVKREEEKRENEGKVLASLILILIRPSFLVVTLYSSVTASSAAISSSATIRRFHFSDDEEGTRIQRRKSYRVLNNKNPRIMLLVYIITNSRTPSRRRFVVYGKRRTRSPPFETARFIEVYDIRRYARPLLAKRTESESDNADGSFNNSLTICFVSCFSSRTVWWTLPLPPLLPSVKSALISFADLLPS